MADKDHLNLIITGHIDNGKSTTMGHFLMDMGIVDERTIAAHAKESEETGKGDSFKYAWVMDNIKDERARGITIDLAFKKFETPKFFFTLIDAPGHRDFVKNMITGASEADCAVLVLSAKEGETDTAIAPGGQAREHAFLLKTLGVKQLIVAINKMDDSKFSEDAFNFFKFLIFCTSSIIINFLENSLLIKAFFLLFVFLSSSTLNLLYNDVILFENSR